MKTYAFEGICQKTHQKITGHHTCQSVSDLYQYLFQKGILLTTCRGRDRKFMQRPLSDKKLSSFFEQLAELIQNGYSLQEALQTIQKLNPQKDIRNLIENLILSLQKGDSLSKSFSHLPEIKDQLSLNLLQACEMSGHFVKGFTLCAHYHRWRDETKKYIFGSLRYPLLLYMVMGFLLFVLCIFVLPQLKELLYVLYPNGVPQNSQLLLAFTNFATDHFGVVLGIYLSPIVLLVFLYGQLGSMLVAKKSIIGLKKLSLPLLRLQLLYRLSVLLESGIPLFQGIQNLYKGNESDILKKDLDAIIDRLEKGDTLSEILNHLGYSPLCVQDIKIGEQTGTLPEKLSKAVETSLFEWTRKSKKLLTGLQPAMILIVGGLMLWIVMAMILPIYTSFDFSTL